MVIRWWIAAFALTLAACATPSKAFIFTAPDSSNDPLLRLKAALEAEGKKVTATDTADGGVITAWEYSDVPDPYNSVTEPTRRVLIRLYIARTARGQDRVGVRLSYKVMSCFEGALERTGGKLEVGGPQEGCRPARDIDGEDKARNELGLRLLARYQSS